MQKKNKDQIKKDAAYTFKVTDAEVLYYTVIGELYHDQERATDRNYELGEKQEAGKLTRQEVEGKNQGQGEGQGKGNKQSQ